MSAPDCIDALDRRYPEHDWTREVCDLPIEICTNCGQRRIHIEEDMHA